jgi:hypothetical protein
MAMITAEKLTEVRTAIDAVRRAQDKVEDLVEGEGDQAGKVESERSTRVEALKTIVLNLGEIEKQIERLWS